MSLLPPYPKGRSFVDTLRRRKTVADYRRFISDLLVVVCASAFLLLAYAATREDPNGTALVLVVTMAATATVAVISYRATLRVREERARILAATQEWSRILAARAARDAGQPSLFDNEPLNAVIEQGLRDAATASDSALRVIEPKTGRWRVAGLGARSVEEGLPIVVFVQQNFGLSEEPLYLGMVGSRPWTREPSDVAGLEEWARALVAEQLGFSEGVHDAEARTPSTSGRRRKPD